MGQRLNIEIRKDNKVLANAYYHWSGYTSSALGLTKKILDSKFLNMSSISDKVKAVRMLEVTGAGLTKNEFNEEFTTPKYKQALDRNEGLIAISQEGISETQKWEEARVEIHIDTKMLNLKLYWDLDEDDIDKDTIIEKVGTNYFNINFDNFEKVNSEIYNFIENKNYYFEYENKKYGFIE